MSDFPLRLEAWSRSDLLQVLLPEMFLVCLLCCRLKTAEVVLLAEVELGPWGDVVGLAVGGQMNASAAKGCIL